MKENGDAQHMLTLQQTARWLPADMDTPISLFMGMVGAGNGILLESAEVDGRWGRYSILACDAALFISCRDGKLALDIRNDILTPLARFEGKPFVDGLRALMAALTIAGPANITNLPPITRALYGYLGFGMAGLFNPKLAPVMPQSEADCLLMLPSTVLVFDHLYNRLCQVSLGEHRALQSSRESLEARATGQAGGVRINPDNVCAEPGEEGYKDYVRRIKEMLRQGEAIQVVPSVRFSTPFEGNPFELYRRMRRFNASPYMFYMRFPDLTLFGSSPEVMVRCTAGHLQLSPIAGTRKRGADDLEDAALAAELRDDPKERAEHVMLVDLGRNDLGRVAQPGSVNLERYV
ncbi:MAG: anthranilate synthase component I family protein, partial [Desulfovibrio desulfuricans]|nr:anthranilate synthase component I family protein [Desulfovibrio desulfuricans]